ncbi:MAG TPA: methionine--tRNA ligase [Terriglobia bacterium]|nr:methionine--tRNA ligase [Terriglobia bacterium]
MDVTQQKPKFYLTTPIYYPNARPHVGSAYTTIACDAIARYKRMCGYDVVFLTGTDEHGEKLQRAADAAGVPVEEFVAEKRELFKNLWRTLGISEYRFVHTSQNPDHVKAVHWMIRQADKAGYIEKKKYEGRYCIFDERYVSDSPEPADCDICGRPAELIREENYFFKLSAFQDRLLKHYEEHPEFVLPSYRMNEVESFVKSGLRDISISRRRLKWGIPWPDDPDQVVYVWYDALTSYLTGIGFRGDERSKDFEKYWMGAEGPAEVVHMIGKDIIRFHAVYWPAFLMAAGLPLPKTIFAHGWIYYERDKMSKSKGNVVYPEPTVQALDEMGAPGNDALRYYLLRDTPFGQDGSFSYDGLIDRYNFDLANDLGNLANRTITMIQRYAQGRIPRRQDADRSQKVPVLRESLYGLLKDFRRHIDGCDLFRALAGVSGVVGDLNSFLNSSEPWALAASIKRSPFPPPGFDVRQPDEEPRSAAEDETGQQLLNESLYVTADVLRCAAVLLSPFMPVASQRLWEQLGCEGSIAGQRLDDLQWGQLKPGTKVGKPEPIFPRLDKEKTLVRLRELAEADRAHERAVAPVYDWRPETAKGVIAENQPQTPEHTAATSPTPPAQPPLQPATQQAPTTTESKITIEDFSKVEMRVGQVVSAEAIPGAKKLLKLMVDIGTEVRQVCAGIAEYYQPAELVGLKIVLVANLAPRKLRGVESNGMVVAASVGENGRPVLATFKEDVPNGTRLK